MAPPRPRAFWTAFLRKRAKRGLHRVKLVVSTSMLLPPGPAIQERVKHVTNTYSGLVMAGKEKFAADPFVIATAEVHGFTVITEEKGIETLKKIPGVCRAMGLPCINLVTLFDEEDWT